MKRLFFIALASLLILLVNTGGRAEDETRADTSSLENKLLELELQMLEMQRQHAEQMKSMAQKIEALRKELETVQTSSNTAGSSPAVPQDYGTRQTSAAKAENFFNPKISVITDLVGVYGEQGEDSTDEMLVREVEIGFSGHVDTWGRFDMTTTMHNEVNFGFDHGFDMHDHDHAEEGEHGHGGGLVLEEGYFTFLTLPGGFQSRVGKFRVGVGKTNEYHPHSLPWTEYPLAIRSYLGMEGLTGTGVALSWLAPLDLYTELSYEFYKAAPEHESGIAVPETDSYTHLLGATTFVDLSDSLSLELGGTSLVAPVEAGIEGDDTWLNSLDLTLKWAPFGDGSYREFEWRTEIFGLRKTLAAHDEHDHEDDDHAHEESLLLTALDEDHDDHGHEEEEELSRETMLGLYSSLAYRFNRWWEAGVRYDFVEGPFDIHQEETEYSFFLTWWQSEYAYWRLNMIRNELSLDSLERDDLYKVYLQFNFSLGPHPAHKY